jgi:uncharacterized protein
MVSAEFVACNGCTKCCKGDTIFLHPDLGDDLAFFAGNYKTEFNPLANRRQFALLHKRNGDCVYLGESGCTIYEKRPAICKTFSCVGVWRKLQDVPRPERRRLLRSGMLGREVYDEGRKPAARGES